MRKTARVALAMVVLLGGMWLLPRSFSSGSIAYGGVPTPLLTELLKPSSSSPSPTPTQSSGGGSGGGDTGDDSKDGSGGTGSGSGDGSGDGKAGTAKRSGGRTKADGAGTRRTGNRNKVSGRKGRGGAKGVGADAPPIFAGTFVPTGPKGSFDTDRLVAIAGQLRSLGWSEEQVLRKVYPPFIIGGPAAWTNTWGAPRYGPGPIVRTHQGQDVFCSFGDPVLAPQGGRYTFARGGLGGVVARVHRPDGSYWYLAHLSALNEELRRGQHVSAGTVVGYCGNSGNALTTPPHVHFGWYEKWEGEALNPMRPLIDWLHEAERRAESLLAQASRTRVKQISRLTAARRFGDTLLPPIAELEVSSEALLASAQNPAGGTFGLAEAALHVALSDGSMLWNAPHDVALEAGADAPLAFLDPEQSLAELLRGGSHDHPHPEAAD